MPRKKKIEVINLTGHNVVLYQNNEEKIIIPPATDEDGGTIRMVLPYFTEGKGTIKTDYGAIAIAEYDYVKSEVIEQMTPKKEGRIYIVSSIVAQRFPHRDDYYIIGQVVKDPITKKILGAKFLVPNPYYKIWKEMVEDIKEKVKQEYEIENIFQLQNVEAK